MRRDGVKALQVAHDRVLKVHQVAHVILRPRPRRVGALRGRNVQARPSPCCGRARCLDPSSARERLRRWRPAGRTQAHQAGVQAGARPHRLRRRAGTPARARGWALAGSLRRPAALRPRLAKIIVVVRVQDPRVVGWEGVGALELVTHAVGDSAHHLRHPPLVRARHAAAQHRRCARPRGQVAAGTERKSGLCSGACRENAPSQRCLALLQPPASTLAGCASHLASPSTAASRQHC